MALLKIKYIKKRREGMIMEWMASWSIHSEVLMKITLALVLSLIIGVEREVKKKPIGLKTSAVIATFSCLLTIVSMESAYLVPGRDDINVTMDPLRLAAQVVSGIGFLGAGAILRKGNDHISGLTTAAMIWGSAGIGIAVGAGFYIEAIFTVISVMFIVEVVAPGFNKIGPKRLRGKEVPCTLILLDKAYIPELLSYLDTIELKVERLKIKQSNMENAVEQHTVNLLLTTVKKRSTFKLYNDLSELPYISSVEVEIIP